MDFVRSFSKCILKMTGKERKGTVSLEFAIRQKIQCICSSKTFDDQMFLKKERKD
jgi:hypothetical protein